MHARNRIFRIFVLCCFLPCVLSRPVCVFCWFRGRLFPLACSFSLGLLLSQAGQVSVWDKYNPKEIWKEPDLLSSFYVCRNLNACVGFACDDVSLFVVRRNLSYILFFIIPLRWPVRLLLLLLLRASMCFPLLASSLFLIRVLRLLFYFILLFCCVCRRSSSFVPSVLCSFLPCLTSLLHFDVHCRLSSFC